jgi:trk system potassium uptake protein TrkA
MMRLVIVGGGRLVYFLARALRGKKHHVTIVSRTREDGARLARSLDALVIAGDGTDPDVLEEAAVGAADQVLALTEDDHVNLVVCQLARMRFLVPRVLALVNDPDNERVFATLGVPTTFSPIPVLACLIEQRSAFGAIVDLLPVAEGRVRVSEVVLPAASPALGRALESLGLPRGTLVGAIVRGDDTLVPNGASVLEPGDRVVVIARPEGHAAAMTLLTGER